MRIGCERTLRGRSLRFAQIAVVLSVLAIPFGYAFDTGHHSDVTRTVLHERGFGETAIEITLIYNWLTDYYSNSPTSETPIQGAREVIRDLETLHFDNLFTPQEIDIAWGWLTHNLETATREAARDRRPEHALILLGLAGHAVQDFYSHSNWVETHPRAVDGPYRCDTFASSRSAQAEPLYTGMFDNTSYREPPRARTRAEEHGTYDYGLNKDSHVRPLWDEAYVFAYCATQELVAAMERWSEEAQPGFWDTVREYTYRADGTLSGSLDGVRSKWIEMNLKAVHDLSLWVAGTDGADGHWKGNHSGSKRFFAATSAQYVSRGRRAVGNAILEELLLRKLVANLYASVPPSATPKIEAFSPERRAVIVRVTRIAEKDDLKKLERRIDPRAISGRPDYYARITIDGQLYLDRTLQNRKDFDRAQENQAAWVAMHFVDASVTEVPIEIEVWDEDDTSADGAYKNTQADINKTPGKRSIEFRYRLFDGRLSGDVETVADGEASAIETTGERPDKYRAVMTFEVAHRALGDARPASAVAAAAPTAETLGGAAARALDRRPGPDENRPYADMSDTLGTMTAIPIRGRLIEERQPIDLARAIPRAGILQREIKNTTVEFVILDATGGDLVSLGGVKTDDEGYIDTVLAAGPDPPAPGRYVIEVRLENSIVGRLRAHLLGEDDRGLVIRSDVDMTYLNTDFESIRAKFNLLNMNGGQREALPGMAATYRFLRTGADGDLDRPVVFISGSPSFFKRTLESKLDLDGIVHDGLILKPFKAIAWNAKSEPWKIGSKLEEQVGYKLHALLQGRLEMPPGVSEILMGDDTEADFAIYALYHRLTSRQMSPEAMRARLREMNVEPFWLDRIDQLLARVLAHLDNPSPVKAIYINRTDRPNPHDSVDNWAVPGILLYHSGAAPLIRDLVDKGLAPEIAVREVVAEMNRR